MSGNRKWTTAAAAGVFALASLLACGTEQSVAEVQKEEKTAAGAGHEGHEHGHEGHEMPDAAPQPAAPAPDHAGHSQAGDTPPAPVAELPTEPASILRPDPLDAPAATSVLDAQRSEEMNQAMSGGHGGHGGHGAGTYRQVDAGRGPGAHEGSEPHDHGAALYVCPMHPEVTGKTPGTCPKCGMALVERREE